MLPGAHRPLPAAPPSGNVLQPSGCPGYRFGSWSLQSSPACTATPVFDVQLAAACPSPSSSFATYSHTPWSALHLPAAQSAGAVIGTVAAQSASVEQPTVASAPPWLPDPPS